MIEAAKKSPLTTWGGVLGALGGLVLAIGEAMGHDGAKAIGSGIMGLAALVVGAAARDHGVTSEQAGAK
jgi:hypothetical protein